MPIPAGLILDTSTLLRSFESILKKHNLDVVDTDRLINDLFLAIKLEEHATLNIYNVLDTYLALASNDLDGIFDEYDFCGKGFYILNDLLLDLLMNIFSKVRELRLYYNGEFPFDFVTVLPNRDLLFEKQHKKFGGS